MSTNTPLQDVSDRKENWLASFCIDNSTAILVMTFLFVILGIVTYIGIPKEAQPDITIPNIIVITTYPGVSPEDMESLVTRKLEDNLTEIANIKKMQSTTLEGYSSINVEFNTGIDMDEALQKVREKVDLAKPDLPPAANDPIVQEINLSEFPIMQVNLSGQYSLERLKKVAEDLQDRLETIPQVLEVTLAGGLEREVKIDVDLQKLKYYGISFNDVIEAIGSENITIPGGTIDVGSKKYLVRVPGEYKNPSKLEELVVKSPNGIPVYLRDVARVDFGYKERSSYARLDGSPVITLSVKKRTGQNMIETADNVRRLIAEETPRFPPTTVVKITSDGSKDVRSMVANLENNIISGLILVVGVLLFFMGTRNSFFVGVSIPMSMFISFIIMDALGMTMNMIVLFSLILALGMLVDNAIVVVENIYRYVEEGYDNITAAKKGTGEVAIPIISGTLTTLGAFFPMLFWDGIIGEFMGFLPKTLIITLSASLFVGLVINPVLCALYMKLETAEDKGPGITRKGKIVVLSVVGFFGLLAFLSNPVTVGMLYLTMVLLVISDKWFLNPVGKWWQAKGLPWVIDKYEVTLDWALAHRGATIGLTIMVFFVSFVVFGKFNVGTSFFPETIPPPQVYVQVEAPVGTNVDFTDGVIREIEKRLQTVYGREDVETVVANSGARISGDGMSGGGNPTNMGTVAVNFVDYQARQNDVFKILENMTTVMPQGVAGAEVKVEKPQNGPPTGKPINLEISGPEIPQLVALSERVMRTLENDSVYAKLEGLGTDLPDSRPELNISIDRERAKLYGLNTQKIGNTIRSAINGIEASKYRDGEDEYDITVRLRKEDRSNLEALGDLTVLHEGTQIPLSAVATWEVKDGFGGINRKNGKRVITVSADVRSPHNANAVLAEVQQVLSPITSAVPAGYAMKYTGASEEQDASFAFLIKAFMMAIFIITFILVAQFNSLIKPAIVMTSVIMSISGVLYGLVIFKMPFIIIMTMIGIISLAGVVVNNAIVLIDYVDLLRSRDNMPLREALKEAGATRFRPVILTAVTTVLGLVPLAIGFNLDFIVLVSDPVEFFRNFSLYVYSGGEQAEWWGSMSISVIVGLTFATGLTLIVVPVLYSITDSVTRWGRRFFKGIPDEEPAVNVDALFQNGNGKHNGSIAKQEAGSSV
jgi:multidrug efflux pump subunit AcrB